MPPSLVITLMLPTENEVCEYCDEPASIEVLEYFSEERSFLLDCCCEAMHEIAVSILPTLDRRELCAWFESFTGFRLRQLILDSESPTWTVDPNLEFYDVTWPEARDFIALHHRENKVPQGWKFGAGLKSSSEFVAVMIAGRPVARNIDPRKVVEITRVCVKGPLFLVKMMRHEQSADNRQYEQPHIS
jgi:hypothetical protein